MKYLGLDIGFSRVGTAVGELGIGLAFAREILDYKHYMQQVEKIIAEEKIDTLVVGVPHALSGKKSEHERKIEQEINALREVFSIPVEIFDEQFTTKIAEQSLHFMGINSKKQKNKKDAMAAALILQGFLDREKNRK